MGPQLVATGEAAGVVLGGVMFRIIAALAALLVITSGAEADTLKQTRKWSVGTWTITEYPEMCSGSASLRSGATLLWFVITDKGLAAIVANQAWRMSSGGTSETLVEVDGQTYGQHSTAAFSNDAVLIKLPPSMLSPLQDGDVLTLRFDRATYSFPLTQTRQGLAALVECDTRRRKASPAPTSDHRRVAVSKSGTGMFVSGQGHVLTNAHVVEGCATTALRVTTSTGKTVGAVVAASDPLNDLALLRAPLSPPRFALFRRSSVKLGEAVAAFGFPFAAVLASSGNFTQGSVSATAGLGDDTRYMQISAPIQPGNSGGPLFDAAGNVVGVVTEKLNDVAVLVATRNLPQNVNFALKEAIARNFLESRNVAAEEGRSGPALEPTELADRAQEISVFIRCDGSHATSE